MATIFYPAPAATAPYISDVPWSRPPDFYNPASVSWVEIVASTPEEWSGVGINVFGGDSDARLAHIAMGATAPETIIATIPAQGDVHSVNFAPVSVPAGTRLWVAMLGWTTTTTPVQIWGLTTADAGGASGFTNMDSGPYEIEDTTPRYAIPALTVPATADTFGAWTELSFTNTLSLDNNRLNGNSLSFKYDFLMPQIKLADTASNTIVDLVFQLGVGAAGSEVVVSEWAHKYNSNLPRRVTWDYTAVPIVWGHPVGSRVSARYRISTVSVNVAPSMVLMGIR